MSDTNDANDQNNLNTPWSHEQAPFAGAEASAAGDVAPETASTGGNAAGPGSSAGAYAGGAAGAPPAGSWGSVGGAGYVPPPGYTPPPAAVSSSEPNPVVAFLLGLIPGVGAMYNGQIPKGFVHLIVFAVLVTIANNVNGIFGIFVAGWIFFQAFEAYHTAKARRDGLPLPNAFGWNDIGERVGLGKNWPFSPATAPAGQGPTTAAAAATSPGSARGWTAAPPPAAGTSATTGTPFPAAGSAAYTNVTPNWAGYVAPTAFAGPPPTGAGGMGAIGAVPPGHGVPYAPVSAGAYPPYSPQTPGGDAPVTSRLPVGAIWLIGLGVLFLLGQWTPLLQFSRVWIPSLVLAAVAVLLFARRMGWTGSPAWQQQAGLPMGVRVATALRVPGALLTIAVLNGLHEAWVVRWYRSWPVLLIVIGVLMLVERMALRQAADFATQDDTRHGADRDAAAGGL